MKMFSHSRNFCADQMNPECRNLWEANRPWPLALNCWWANKQWHSHLVCIFMCGMMGETQPKECFSVFLQKKERKKKLVKEVKLRVGQHLVTCALQEATLARRPRTPHLLVFTRLQPPRLSADGWKRAEKLKDGGGGRVGWASSTFSFPSCIQTRVVSCAAICWPAEEDAICLGNSAGNTGGKHRLRLNIKSIQRAAAETFKPSAAGAHSCRAKEPLWQNTAAGRGGLEDE